MMCCLVDWSLDKIAGVTVYKYYQILAGKGTIIPRSRPYSMSSNSESDSDKLYSVCSAIACEQDHSLEIREGQPILNAS
jgi:hypothetical protein